MHVDTVTRINAFWNPVSSASARLWRGGRGHRCAGAVGSGPWGDGVARIPCPYLGRTVVPATIIEPNRFIATRTAPATAIAGIDDTEKRKSVKVGVPGTDPADAMLAHQHRGVQVVEQIAGYVGQLLQNSYEYRRMTRRREHQVEPGRTQQRFEETPGFAGRRAPGWSTSTTRGIASTSAPASMAFACMITHVRVPRSRVGRGPPDDRRPARSPDGEHQDMSTIPTSLCH